MKLTAIIVFSFYALYILFVAYLAVMNLKRAQDKSTLTKFTYYFSLPIVIFGMLLNVFFNWVIATVFFLDLPKEAFFSKRLERYSLGKDSWRRDVALEIAENLLDPFDPDGEHIDKRLN